MENSDITSPLKYCLYARKSSEDDERQALSIDSQIKEMMEVAQNKGVDVVEVKKEAHSAKDSGQRSEYNQILEDIRLGEYNAILTWAPDRLSRNAGDLGTLVDLMDQGFLKEIRTPSQTFTNSPNEKFLLMILCSQAKLENDNKGVNVKRGMKSKCESGYRPCMSPLGYLQRDDAGKKGNKKIIIDPKRAPIIKKLFEKVAYEFKSGRDIYRWLNDEVKFKTRAGKKIALSTIYRMLNSPFYYGEFEYPQGSGKWFKGDYEPIITKEIFQRVRDNLMSPKRARNGTKEFYFTKMITCGSCGCGISAEEKFKKLSDGTTKRYVYYLCSGKGLPTIKYQEQPIREEDLINELIRLIDKIDLNKKDSLERLKNEVDKYNQFSSTIFGSQAMEIPKKIDLKTYAKYVLEKGTREEKRELLIGLKSKLVLKDKKVEIVKNLTVDKLR